MDYKLFRLFADNNPQPMWIKDSNLKNIYINKEFKSIYKNMCMNFYGKSDEELSIKEDLREYYTQVINSLKPVIKEGDFFGKYSKITIIPLVEENKLVGLAGVYDNVNSYSKKYKTMKKEISLVKMIMDTLPGKVFYKDKNGKYLYVNKTSNDFFNKNNIDKLIGKTNFDINDKQELTKKCTEEDNEVIMNKRSIKVETVLDSVNGHKIYTETIKVPVIDKNEEVSGIVGLILDITEKKNFEEKLKQLSFKDILTGLYNRTYFEEKVKEFSNEKYIPIGVIMGDANGLKLVNDTLGHAQGDLLLKLIAQVFMDVCNENQFIFRTGGDEFVILSPNTTEEECENIIKEIFNRCKNYKHDLIELSISLGAAVTYDLNNKSIFKALTEADAKVYRQKLLQKNSINNSMMASLKLELETKSLETQEHTNRVLKYSTAIGKKLCLPMWLMDELTIVATLHDIGKIGINEDILLKKGELTEDEFEIVKTHTEKGYRIIKAFNQLDSVARSVLAHHERWDGKGYPLKLSGEKIPLIARIVSVADSYDAMTNNSLYKKNKTKNDAIEELKKCGGKQFDPQIVKVFIECLMENDEKLIIDNKSLNLTI